jgi:hypothetical protein
MMLSKHQSAPSIQLEIGSFQKSVSRVTPKLGSIFSFQKSILYHTRQLFLPISIVHLLAILHVKFLIVSHVIPNQLCTCRTPFEHSGKDGVGEGGGGGGVEQQPDEDGDPREGGHVRGDNCRCTKRMSHGSTGSATQQPLSPAVPLPTAGPPSVALPTAAPPSSRSFLPIPSIGLVWVGFDFRRASLVAMSLVGEGQGRLMALKRILKDLKDL